MQPLEIVRGRLAQEEHERVNLHRPDGRASWPGLALHHPQDHEDPTSTLPPCRVLRPNADGRSSKLWVLAQGVADRAPRR